MRAEEEGTFFSYNNKNLISYVYHAKMMMMIVYKQIVELFRYKINAYFI